MQTVDRPAWTQAKNEGTRAELGVQTLLRGVGCNVTRAADDKGSPHDLTVSTWTLEIKRDLKAPTTGNIAVEVSYRGAPSGITTSTADTWVICIQNEALFVRTAALRDMVNQSFSRVPAGEGAVVCLLPIDRLRTIARHMARAA